MGLMVIRLPPESVYSVGYPGRRYFADETAWKARSVESGSVPVIGTPPSLRLITISRSDCRCGASPSDLQYCLDRQIESTLRFAPHAGTVGPATRVLVQ